MSHLADLPVWATVAVALLTALGAVLTLLGTIGLVWLPDFYDRLHAPTLGTSWGAAGILLGSMLLFSVTGTRPVFHELVVGVLIMVTTPVTTLLLAGAARHRDGKQKPDPG